MSEIIDAIPLPPIFYHVSDTSYWRQAGNGVWIKVNDTSAKNFIAECGYSKKPSQPGINSDVEKCMMRIQEEHNVDYVGALAGYPSGVRQMGSIKVLVTKTANPIEPREGNWDTLGALWTGRFVDGDNDQRPYFFGWLKSALATYSSVTWQASQLLALAGPVGSGKSLTQNLITKMLGGRSVKPYQFMMGDTAFNGHLFAGEHLMLEDEAESIDIKSRQHFGANIKTILTNRDQNCHGKNREAITLQPLWRMTLSLNDDPERLQILPPLNSDIRDKIILLKVSCSEMPMPTGTPELDAAFMAQLESELPAFLHFIQNYEIPSDLIDSRFGIASYQHPEIVDKLEQTSPELQLMQLIDNTIFGLEFEPRAFVGKALDLEDRMRRSGFHKIEVERLLRFGTNCGTYLGRLHDSEHPSARGRITKYKTNGHTQWTIQPPASSIARDIAPIPPPRADSQPPQPSPALQLLLANTG